MEGKHQFLVDLDKKLWTASDRLRAGEVLFIDARKLGYMVDRVLRPFTDEDTAQIVSTSLVWKRDDAAYEDIPGFCESASLKDDGVPFAEKMEGLTRELANQIHESEKEGNRLVSVFAA